MMWTPLGFSLHALRIHKGFSSSAASPPSLQPAFAWRKATGVWNPWEKNSGIKRYCQMMQELKQVLWDSFSRQPKLLATFSSVSDCKAGEVQSDFRMHNHVFSLLTLIHRSLEVDIFDLIEKRLKSVALQIALEVRQIAPFLLFSNKTINAPHKQAVAVHEPLTLIHLTFFFPCFNYIYSFPGGLSAFLFLSWVFLSGSKLHFSCSCTHLVTCAVHLPCGLKICLVRSDSKNRDISTFLYSCIQGTYLLVIFWALYINPQ